MADRPQITCLLSSLYATLEAPDSWPGFLLQVAAAFRSRGAQIIHQDMQDFRLSFTKVHGYEWSPETYETYAALIPEDPRLDLFMEAPGRALHCRMGVTDAQYHQSRVYREVLCAAGVEYLCGVNFGENREHLSGMFLIRDTTQAPFTADDCAQLQLLVPHIRRVLNLHGFVGRLEQSDRISRDTLDALGAAVMVLDANGQIDFANESANALLSLESEIHQSGGQLFCETRDGESLQAILGQVRASGSMRPFEVLRDQGDPMLVFVAPIETAHGRFDPKPLSQDGALVVLRSPDLQESPAAQAHVLELLWKLTPSQARLACLLSRGETLRSAAAEMGITEASARQYLKTVFQKLNVSRQSDMLRKVLSVLVSAKRD
ncbi:hypothetical protein [Hoeflea sp.]|uniref:hypothetical protein n=1 Tax=Hoeflea sp. TaxID=1940281 RepID=UPI0019B8731E|nr:hypothetical protein [Hoeflea sp.]MBC7282516.1 hypothetical protein [Hoeflea sp.]